MNSPALILRFLFPFCVFFLIACCTKSVSPLYPLYIGDTVFYVELATDDDEYSRGLMHRQSLTADQGMLFIFPDSQIRSFWMRNTYIDLSIAYIDSNGIIIDIFDMKSLDETPISSTQPVQYALELNQGAFKGIYPGDQIDFREIPLP